jgi:tRNA (guanine-N7-)-methyltransferase
MSLPAGLSSYEFIRELVPSRDLPNYFHLHILKDEKGLPLLAPEGAPQKNLLDIEAFFGQKGPIEIEIGCGKGTFLNHYCENHPDLSFVALEWEAEFAFYSAERLAKRPHLKHARVVLGDAQPFLRDFLPESCAQALHVYFPDPWPKKRHHKHRTMRPDFLELMRRVALPGALFYFGTDHAEYNEAAQEVFAATPWLEMLDRNAPPTEGIMTNFEIKYRAEGRPIYRYVMRITKDEGRG